MKKILKNGLLIIIIISITTYLTIGLASIYRSNINRHNNLSNNVDNELVYDNKNNNSSETKDDSSTSNKNNSSSSSSKDNSSTSSKNNSSSSSKDNSSTSSKNNSSSSSKNNSSSSSKNNSSSSSKNNSSSTSSKNNSSTSNKNNSSSSSNKNNSSASSKNNSSTSSKNNSSSSSNKNNSSTSSKNNSSTSSKNNSSTSSKNNSSSSSKNNSSSTSSKNNSSTSNKNNSSTSNKNNSSTSNNNSSSSSNNNSSNSSNNSSSTKPSQTVKVTGVSLNKTSAEIYLNNDTGISVNATVSPSNATNKNITWSSSNSNIASVNNGYITAHNPGAATITVKTVDGNKQASINVIVKKKVIVIIGASQVTRMVWYKNNYSSSKYKYNIDNGTLVYVNESGTGIDWQNTTGISRAKSIISKYNSYKNYTYFYVFFPLSGNTIQSFSCDEISSTNSTIKKFASGYNTSIQSLKNSGYNVNGYVVSMHPVRVSQRGNNTKIVTNEDANSCTKSYRSNYKYYKFNRVMKSIVESSYSNNLKYESIFVQIMDTKQGKKENFSYKITYNTTDGMHWDSNTTNTYVNMMLGYVNEL